MYAYARRPRHTRLRPGYSSFIFTCQVRIHPSLLLLCQAFYVLAA
jgi:hypothetical protein